MCVLDLVLSAGGLRGGEAERDLQQFSSAEAVDPFGAQEAGGGGIYCADRGRQPAQQRDRADSGGEKALRGDGGSCDRSGKKRSGQFVGGRTGGTYEFI